MIFSWLRARRRAKILDEPFPPHWLAILERNVGHWRRLDAVEQAKLKDSIRILVAEKRWEGAHKFPINDEIKVTIAAQASLPLLGLDHDYYRRVPSIVVYAGAYEVPDLDEFGDVDDTFPAHVVEGQAVYRGAVLLAWQNVLAESREPEAGHSVVIHEFAHQLDYLDNAIDGTPPLEDPDVAVRWGKVMQAAFDRHLRDLKANRDTFFTEHAGDSPTEYFADASEAFFCVPHDLAHEEPEVFELLVAYYRLDPRKWFS